ncbi:MAG: ATP phosphoribosyltransferase regulatory subunit [Gammaproteobacteria bacterium]|nr:ATP phosphoribosyltransferase regulatory subunit [Gammaproteobacteria bacterium]
MTGISPSGSSWQLPDGVEELLPAAAWQLEGLRRRFIDQCDLWGFDLVMPPMIEYIDSLLTGTGETMDLQTFKLVDQQNGRTLGVRADITPQVARIDAHALRSDSPNRLFYVGTVLRTRSDGLGGSRSPMQFGAELFGHAGPQSDIEIVQLMLDTALLTGINPSSLILDLGHVGVYKALISEAGLDSSIEAELYDALQRGSAPDVQAVVLSVPGAQTNPVLMALQDLPNLRGDIGVLDQRLLPLIDTVPALESVLSTLKTIITAVTTSHPEVQLHIDLGDLRGFRYHTGALFAVLTDTGVELAHGGRYDAIGAAFGHPRSATGFSGDMKNLSDVMPAEARRVPGVFVAYEDAQRCQSEIARRRQQGERVLVGLPDISVELQKQLCDRQLVFIDEQWVAQDIT